jgi:hypothetical protein
MHKLVDERANVEFFEREGELTGMVNRAPDESMSLGYRADRISRAN